MSTLQIRIGDANSVKSAYSGRKRLTVSPTIRVSRNPTTAITANEKVRTNEEATVHVYDLDLFVTVQIFEDTPAVASLGKLCEDHGYSFEWTSGLKKKHVADDRTALARAGVRDDHLFRR